MVSIITSKQIKVPNTDCFSSRIGRRTQDFLCVAASQYD